MSGSKTAKLLLQLYFLPLALIYSAGIPVSHLHHFIESPKFSEWGTWGEFQHCPSDQVVIGMRLKVHANQGLKDDSGLNAIKFYCQNPYSTADYTSDIVSITSLVGTAGDWKKEFFCPITPEGKHVAVGFQLRSEKSSGVKDDTAGNNLKLICSDLYQKQEKTYLEGDGTSKGDWTNEQICSPGYAICGIQTQVEMSRSMDATGLNNLKVRCCKADGAANSVNVTGVGEGSKEKEMPSGFQHRSGEEFASEQELIAIIPNVYASSESLFPGNPTSDNTELDEERQLTTDNTNSEADETLPEEISEMDQVDNSEAQEGADKPSSTHIENVPHDVAHAMEDADPRSLMEEEEPAISEPEEGESEDEDFSLYTNYKESNERTNFHMQDSEESSEFGAQTHTLGIPTATERSPHSSYQYGQTEEPDSSSREASTSTPTTSAASSSNFSKWCSTLGISYMMMLAFAKLI